MCEFSAAVIMLTGVKTMQAQYKHYLLIIITNTDSWASEVVDNHFYRMVSSTEHNYGDVSILCC